MLAWGRRGIASRWRPRWSRAVDALGVTPTWRGASCPRSSARRSCFGAVPKSKRQAQEAYEGIVPRLEARLVELADVQRAEDTDDDPDDGEGGIADDELGRFLVTRTCDACKGRRLRPEALAVKLGERDIAELGAMPLRHVRKFVEGARRHRRGSRVRAALRSARARHRRAAAQGGGRAPGLPHRRRPRLPDARPQRADALVAARASASASPRRSAPRSSASSTCSTSPASACTPATTPGSSRRRPACATSATPSSSSSTTARPSSPPTTSSTWGPARASTAARSSRRARRPS